MPNGLRAAKVPARRWAPQPPDARAADRVPQRLRTLVFVVPTVVLVVCAVGSVVAGPLVLPAELAIFLLLGGAVWRLMNLRTLAPVRHVAVPIVWFWTAWAAASLLFGSPARPAPIDLGSARVAVSVAAACAVAAGVGGWFVVIDRRHPDLVRRGRHGALDTWTGASRAWIVTGACGALLVVVVAALIWWGGPVSSWVAVPLGVALAGVLAPTTRVRIDPEGVTYSIAGVQAGQVRAHELRRVRVVHASWKSLGVRGDVVLGAGTRVAGGGISGAAVMRRGPAIEFTTARGWLVISADDARSAAVLLARHMERARKTVNGAKDPKENPRR